MAQTAAPDADQEANSQTPALARRQRRRVGLFIALGVLTYCAGLIAMIPARFVVPDSDRMRVGGTAWNGEAVLGSTMRIAWHWSPMASLLRLGYTANWQMTGGDTDLSGSATPKAGRIVLRDIAGQIDGTLLDAAAPALPLSCRFLAQVQIAQLTLGGKNQMADGNLRSSVVHCTSRTAVAGALDLPALRGTLVPTAGMTTGALVTAPSRQHLIEARLTSDGGLSVWVTPELAARTPLLTGARYDTVIAW